MIVHTGIMKSGTTWLELMLARLAKHTIVHLHGCHKWPEDMFRHFLSMNKRQPISIRDHFRPSTHDLLREYELPIVFVYRHPADVVTSLHYHLIQKWPDKYDGDFSKTLDHFTWVLEGMGWRDYPDVFVTRYEDLHTKPVEELTRLGLYLEMPFERQAIVDTVKWCRFERMHKRQRGEEDRSHWGRKGILGDHVNFLVDERLEMWNERFPNIAQQWGYDGPPAAMGDLDEALSAPLSGTLRRRILLRQLRNEPVKFVRQVFRRRAA